MRRIRTVLIAAVVAVAVAVAVATPVFAQWPTTCVDLNDIVEQHLGRTNNVGIYQRVFGDQAEAACQGDHREDVRGVFAWAFGLATPTAQPAVAGSSLTLANDALYGAVWRGRTEQVRTLVAGGLNANTRSSDNDPLIYSAIWRNYVDIVRILADAGANVNALDSDGDPVLRSAIWRDYAGVVQVLVDAGANVDARDADGQPLLRQAIWRDLTNVARILVDAGADVNARDADGDPLLFEAVWRGHTEMVRILVNAGVDVNARDSDGETALGEAQWRGHTEIVQILLAAPAVAPELGWPTTCVDLNDIVENHLSNDNNVGIYQKVFGDQAEAACQNDHREDVRGVFAWAF